MQAVVRAGAARDPAAVVRLGLVVAAVARRSWRGGSPGAGIPRQARGRPLAAGPRRGRCRRPLVASAGLTVLVWSGRRGRGGAGRVRGGDGRPLRKRGRRSRSRVLLLAATLCTGDLLVARPARPGSGRRRADRRLRHRARRGRSARARCSARPGALRAGALAAALCARRSSRPAPAVRARAPLRRRDTAAARRCAPAGRGGLARVRRAGRRRPLGRRALSGRFLGRSRLPPPRGARHRRPRVAIAASPDLAPQSLLWRNHDAYLALAFLFGGEARRAALQFAVGLAVVRRGADARAAPRRGRRRTSRRARARRVSDGHAAAARDLRGLARGVPRRRVRGASSPWRGATPGRLRTGAFLFGGAVVDKIFALLRVAGARDPRPAIAPASAIDRGRVRRRPSSRPGRGSHGARGTPDPSSLRTRLPVGAARPDRQRSLLHDVARVRSGRGARASPSERLAALPPPALRPRVSLEPLRGQRRRLRRRARPGRRSSGLAGWDARRLFLFVLAAAPVLFLWSLLYLPSVRYLFPLYPLYAVFVAEGLRRLTVAVRGCGGRHGGRRPARRRRGVSGPVRLERSRVERGRGRGRSREASTSRRGCRRIALRGRLAVRTIGSCSSARTTGFIARRRSPGATTTCPVAGLGPRSGRLAPRASTRSGSRPILVREDRRRGATLLGALGDRLEIVARNGPAVLYRVRRGRPGLAWSTMTVHHSLTDDRPDRLSRDHLGGLSDGGTAARRGRGAFRPVAACPAAVRDRARRRHLARCAPLCEAGNDPRGAHTRTRVGRAVDGGSVDCRPGDPVVRPGVSSGLVPRESLRARRTREPGSRRASGIRR